AISLRVHPLDNVWFYFDWLPRPGTEFLTTSERVGVLVDGVDDPSVPMSAIPPWSLVRGPDGGLEVLYDVPPSPYFGSASFFYKDEAAYDAAPLNEPKYASDDRSAIGDHGGHLAELVGNEREAIPFELVAYPLCGDEGDATLGDQIRELIDLPLSIGATL